ncbi:MAG: hypothetical protein K8R59_09235 [Thermoanaerobaculales bacterium]|nr:hypothetical protein [Thermoanaerobaculales bacterium]
MDRPRTVKDLSGRVIGFEISGQKTSNIERRTSNVDCSHSKRSPTGHLQPW